MAGELKVTDKRVGAKEKGNVPATVQSDNALVTIFQIAAQRGYEPAFIKEMMDLQERNDKNEARKAFYAAVATFKENPPEVLKDKENSQFSKGNRKAMYASLGNLVKTVNPALGLQGLSASWTIDQAEKQVKVSCKLSHRLGHSETVTMNAPPDISGGNAKNPIQQIKSTVTYLRGATFEAVTGLAAIDDVNLDDDGNGTESEPNYITEKQLSTIVDKINEKNVNEAKFLDYLEIESLEKIPTDKYDDAMAALRVAKGEKKSRDPGEEG